jgi:hypothetical protein
LRSLSALYAIYTSRAAWSAREIQQLTETNSI